MLGITTSAAEAIRSVLAAVAPPSDASMRISSPDHDDLHWELAISEHPAPHDQVVRESGVELLVPEESAPALDDKVLDARVEGGRIQFLVEERAAT